MTERMIVPTTPASAHYWLAVASAEHVRRGRASGFMQVCHGKAGPLRRIQPGDGIVYYSPSEHFGGSDRLQAFTAIGHVVEGLPYQAEMDGAFRPFRRNVDWLAAAEAPIRPLLGSLDFTAGNSRWGYGLRFGLVALTARDFSLVAKAMGAASTLPQQVGAKGPWILPFEAAEPMFLEGRSVADAPSSCSRPHPIIEL